MKTNKEQQRNLSSNWVKITSIPFGIYREDIIGYIQQWSDVRSFEFCRNQKPNIRSAIFQTESRTKRRKLLGAKPHVLKGIKLKFKPYYPKDLGEKVQEKELHRKIYFNCFPASMTSVDLESIFIRFGKVERIQILRRKEEEDNTQNLGYVVYCEKFPVKRALAQKSLLANKFQATLKVGPTISSLYPPEQRILSILDMENITKFEKEVPKMDQNTEENLAEIIKMIKQNPLVGSSTMESLFENKGFFSQRDLMNYIYSLLLRHQKKSNIKESGVAYEKEICDLISQNHKNRLNLRFNQFTREMNCNQENQK